VEEEWDTFKTGFIKAAEMYVAENVEGEGIRKQPGGQTE
jgi:hypothetical protein